MLELQTCRTDSRFYTWNCTLLDLRYWEKNPSKILLKPDISVMTSGGLGRWPNREQERRMGWSGESCTDQIGLLVFCYVQFGLEIRLEWSGKILRAAAIVCPVTFLIFTKGDQVTCGQRIFPTCGQR